MPLSEIQIKYSNYLFNEKSKSKISIGENGKHKYDGKDINSNQLELILSRSEYKKRFPKDYDLETVTVAMVAAVLGGIVTLCKFPAETIGTVTGLAAGYMATNQLAAKFVMTPQPKENTFIALMLAGGIAGGFSGHEVASQHKQPQKQEQAVVYSLDQSPLETYKLTSGEAVAKKSNEFAYPGVAKTYQPVPAF
jgi:hypothetical protein